MSVIREWILADSKRRVALLPHENGWLDVTVVADEGGFEKET